MAPTELVREVIGDVQRELNTVFNLDRYLGGEGSDQSPVTINVEEEIDVEEEANVEDIDARDADESAGGGSDTDGTKSVDATGFDEE